MIIYNGELYETYKQAELIASLNEDINKTLATGITPSKEDVISACDILAKRIMAGEFDAIVQPFLKAYDVTEEYFQSLCHMFTREGLEEKVRIELCDDAKEIGGTIYRERRPLGVLMHIAAGNFDVLPAYSVVEGLLAGNINILKLPMGDSGLSVMLLSLLITINPALKPFIYVFDVPSTETESIKKLADLSDGVAVWGGDAVVSAARQFASVNTKIIAWGHKLSFAYCEIDCRDEELLRLAKAICSTNQTLCSSCQGLFLDTDSDEELISFGERFFRILKDANAISSPVNYGMRAKNAINIYNEKLEQHDTESVIFNGDGVSVIVKKDSELELSYMFRNVWVKKLLINKIPELHKHKNHLQTAAVLTENPVKRKEIIKHLSSAGVVRITGPDTMSRSISGEAHDGTYALREYSKIVETDKSLL